LHPLARKLAAKKSSKIVTLTNADTENYKKKFGAKQVLTILNPITIDTAEKSPLTQKNVLAIGRFNKQKGFDYLIDIWQQTENRKNGWKLLIVGNGKAKIEKMIAEKIEKYNLAGSVAIIPPTKNVVDLYKNASIYALSSRYEGLPLVLIEATAMGLPIVSFDCETGPRDIILNEKTGFLVPVFDTEKFAQKLDFLMENAEKRKEFSANAIEHSKNFDLQNIVNQWEKLFNEIAK
jgi:glycosyltransferase involved in cell wall biosynthesis